MHGGEPTNSAHVSVLLREVVQYLDPRDGGTYADCTVNGGGHAAAILDRSSPGGFLLGFDADPEALRLAEQRLASYQGRFHLIHANFRQLGQVAAEMELRGGVDGVLLDLGLSSNALELSGRGFSFQRPEEPLDMRFDPTGSPTAADILNGKREEELERIFREFGEEYRARRLARAVVEQRRKQRFQRVEDLLETVQRALGPKRSRLHPATRAFQALRIATNDELGALDEALRASLDVLRPGGRIAVITFHSLEDRMVKHFFRAQAADQAESRTTVLTKKPVVAGREEILSNPRARSAKLRVAERV